MKRRSITVSIILVVLVWGCGDELSREPPRDPPRDPPPIGAEPSSETLQHLTDALRERSGAPGALLGVARGDRRWRFAAGAEDLLGQRPLSAARTFRAGSIMKLLTGALVLRAVEQGKLSLEDPLARFVPSFPRASHITVDMLLSHTAGVTTTWFDQPALQTELTQDLMRVFSAAEVIERLAREEPHGEPGHRRMHYANLDFVLLGEIAAQVYDLPFDLLVQRELLTPLELSATSYGFANPPDLMSGYLELMGIPLDASSVPQTALLSFAGAAGALHSDLDDLLTLLRALFRDRHLLDATSMQRMMLPAEKGSWYGRAAMRFCPCDASGSYSGIGHGGNLPGYWSVAVYYPALDLAVVAAINRDSVGGVPIDHTVFDATLQAVVGAFAP